MFLLKKHCIQFGKFHFMRNINIFLYRLLTSPTGTGRLFQVYLGRPPDHFRSLAAELCIDKSESCEPLSMTHMSLRTLN